MEFADKIRFVREELKLTQEELAAKLNVSFATINRWEQGLVKPRITAEKKLNDFCKDNDIFFGKSNKHQIGYELIAATQLENWFADNQRESQGKFPELMERLIKESLSTIPNDFRFPHGDKISLDGFDAYINVTDPKSMFIPNGESAWEFGATTKSSVSKIITDYKKRDQKIGIEQKKKMTFILVTPSSLKSKSIEKLKKELLSTSWKEVKIYTSVELCEWLSHNLATAIWMFKNICGQELSLDTLFSSNNRLRNSTTPPLSSKLFTASRDKEANNLIDIIQNKKVVKISGPSFYETYGFILSALMESNNEELILRTIVCSDYDSLQEINALTHDKIIILNNSILNYNLVGAQNTIIFIYGKDISDNTMDIILSYRPQTVLIDVLKNDMKVSSKKLGQLSHLAKNNVFLIVRELENESVHLSNPWRNQEDLSLLIPILIVGKINKRNQSDKDLLALFLEEGESPDNYLSKIKHWEKIDNSPIIFYGDYIKVSLKEELWSSVSGYITDKTIELLLKIIKNIFSSHNPKYDLPRDKQFAYQLYNKIWRYNKHVIDGLLDSCILLSIYNNRQSDIDVVINDILNSISTEEMMFTISDYIKPLAECSPDKFVLYFETEIKKDESIIWSLFSNNNSDWLFGGGQYYCNLLWALESLCMLDEYKIRICKILFLLTQKKFTYTISNSPSESLGNILWLYNKSALSPKEKIQFIEQIISKYGESFIPYAIKILFKTSGLLTESSLKWRDPDLKNDIITYDFLYASIDSVFTIILKTIDYSATHIIKLLIDKYYFIPRRTFMKIISYITESYKKNTAEATLLYEYFIVKRYEAIKYNKEDSEQFVKIINDVIPKLKPENDLDSSMIYFKHFGFNDCPILETIDEDYEKKERATREFQNKLLQKLLENNNHFDVLDKIIQVMPNDGYDGIFLSEVDLISDDKLFVKNKLLSYKKYQTLSCFISKNDERENNDFYNQLTTDIFIELIPYIQNNKSIPARVFQNDEHIKMFFRHRHMDNHTEEKDADYIKKYNPSGYFQWLLYDQKEESWDVSEVISVIYNINEDNFSISDHYSLEEILLKLDDKYYNEDIVRLELTFLPIFDRKEIPNGICRYFFENPNEYCIIISRESESITPKMKYEIMNRMQLPKQFTHSQVLQFAKDLMENQISDPIEATARKHNLGEILARSYRPSKEEYIPISLKDLLEEIDDLEVNKGVYYGYENARGLRTITDGSPEIEQAIKLEIEARSCEITHPAAASVLRMLANSRRFNAESDKMEKLIEEGIL